VKREPEYCDTCGELVGYYDPSLPEGEKIVITRSCECARDAASFSKTRNYKKEGRGFLLCKACAHPELDHTSNACFYRQCQCRKYVEDTDTLIPKAEVDSN
jgi:hypothetical protein